MEGADHSTKQKLPHHIFLAPSLKRRGSCQLPMLVEKGTGNAMEGANMAGGRTLETRQKEAAMLEVMR